MFSGPIVPAVAGRAGILRWHCRPLVMAGGELRWIAALYSIGAFLILAEVLSAQIAS
jgi:hypothetical protein